MRPKVLGMIEHCKVAQFMYDDVVHELMRQEDDLVIEIKITVFGATSPASFLILDRYPFERKAIVLVPKCHACMNDRTSKLFVLTIVSVFPLYRSL